MTRHQIQKWINAQGLKIPADRIDKVLNINKRYGERQRRQQLRTAAGLPAGMKTTTVASLQHCIQQNSFEVVSKQPTFSVHSAYVVPGSEAVSYTHLRAHETSLHLVCRLLLEKKK